MTVYEKINCNDDVGSIEDELSANGWVCTVPGI